MQPGDRQQMGRSRAAEIIFHLGRQVALDSQKQRLTQSRLGIGNGVFDAPDSIASLGIGSERRGARKQQGSALLTLFLPGETLYCLDCDSPNCCDCVVKPIGIVPADRACVLSADNPTYCVFDIASFG